MLLDRLLTRLIHAGTLTVIDAKGTPHVFQGTPATPTVTVRLHTPAVARDLFFNPRLKLGEAYMDGTLTVEDSDLYGFLDLIGLNMGLSGRGMTGRVPFDTLLHWAEYMMRPLLQLNTAIRAQRNVAHHYDLEDTLYDLFLDKDKQYSCAYFETGDETLDEAQEKKKRHIARKLCLQDGLRVLDIGSGWGGLGLHIAKSAGVTVDGVTLSTRQHTIAENRAREAGLEDRARFHLKDYRHLDGRYDRIVSVGMFEHVGASHYREFFTHLSRLLADDGVALLHTIGQFGGPGVTNPWIRKYIFPGGYNPSLSEIARALEGMDLCVTDVEVLRLHYAETLKHWRERFLANAAQAQKMFDSRFVRMWEFYLAVSEMAFRRLGHAVFQLQIAKRPDAVPLTRDYLYRADADKSTVPVQAAQ